MFGFGVEDLGLRVEGLRLRVQGLELREFKNNYFAEMCCGSEAGSYLRLIDFCITQL